MSSSKVCLLSGAAAFVSSAVLAAGSQGRDIPVHASAIAGFYTGAAQTHRSAGSDAKTAKCGTGFGAELTSPDAIISWNDTTGSGYNTGGAADFSCSVKTKVKEVWAYGYQAPHNPDLYDVTFYANDPARGSDEANDGRVLCAYTGLVGAGGGSGETGHVLTQLRLPTPCKFKAGKKYWVSIQNNDSDGPWYWEMTPQLSGSRGDWVDRNNKFGTGCSALDNNRYLVDCLGYTYPDYMLELH